MQKKLRRTREIGCGDSAVDVCLCGVQRRKRGKIRARNHARLHTGSDPSKPRSFSWSYLFRICNEDDRRSRYLYRAFFCRSASFLRAGETVGHCVCISGRTYEHGGSGSRLRTAGVKAGARTCPERTGVRYRDAHADIRDLWLARELGQERGLG